MSSERQETVLIVDDMPDNIALLSAALEDSYRVKAVRDGENALRVAESDDPPDLILLDVMMPKMSGYEVCRRLKESERAAGIPVIFVTARTEEADEARGFALGGVDYIQKPVKAAIVRARVKTHLALSRNRKDLQEMNERLRQDGRMREEVEAINRHDLKSPLIVVMNAPKVVRGAGNLTEKQEKLLGLVEQAGNRMLEIINSTVTLYKIEQGTYKMAPEAVDIIEIAQGLRSTVAAMPLGFEIGLRLLVDGTEAAEGQRVDVLGEGLLLQSLFSNLVKNAAEAGLEGECIEVSVESRALVRVCIHNRRVVPEEIRSRFFEKFATFGKQDGTGLGTYTAKLIVDLLGGTIRLESDEKSGTSVIFELPRPGNSSTTRANI